MAFFPRIGSTPEFCSRKVAQAAESLLKVLDALPSTNPLVHTVVMVSELSRPPLTKAMHKLLRNVARLELRAKAAATSQAGGETEESKGRESDEGEEEEVAVMKTLLQRLESQLSSPGRCSGNAACDPEGRCILLWG